MTPSKVRRLIHGIALGASPPGRGAIGPSRALRDLSRAHASWWSHRNVLGMCFARKVAGGVVCGASLQVLVREKRPKSKLRPGQQVPPEIEGGSVGIDRPVPTDVREVGMGRLDVLVSATRPALAGYNIGGKYAGSGTLTCAVADRVTGARLGLSCGHVVARYGQASPGERVLLPSYAEAQANGLLPKARFGSLVRVLPVGSQDSDAAKNVDAATFLPDSPADLEDEVALLGVAPAGVRTDVPLDLPVRKVGYATELTWGTVQALHVLAYLPYGTAPGGKKKYALFADQIGVSHFTMPGDSGSLVLDKDNRAVGLHIGGFEGMSLCTRMKMVLDAVGCDLA